MVIVKFTDDLCPVAGAVLQSSLLNLFVPEKDIFRNIFKFLFVEKVFKSTSEMQRGTVIYS